MTLFWIMNPCALSANTVYNDHDAEGFRKALYTQLFLMFFMYFISQTLHAFVYKNTAQKPKEVRETITQAMMGKQDTRPDLPWHQKKWNRTFAIMFSNHCIAIGMCILFNPFAGAIVLAYIHFIFFIVFIVLQIKLNNFPAKVVRIIIDLLNLTIILIGVIGINFATCNDNNTCKGSGQQLSKQVCFG